MRLLRIGIHEHKIDGNADKKHVKYIVSTGVFITLLIFLSAGLGIASACETYVLVNPGNSIQEAIDSLCPEGGTIELAVGTHTPNASINIINRADITLRGTGASRTDTEIVYSGFPTYDAIFIKNSTNIQIENLYIHTNQSGHAPGRDYMRGIFIWGGSENITMSKLRLENLIAGVASVWDLHVPERSNYYLTITDCEIHHNWHGTIFTHTHNSIIRNCKVSDSYGDVGIQLNSQNHYNLIENNEVLGGSDGMMVYAGCKGNTFRNNGVRDSERDGMRIQGGGYGTDNKIIGNVFTGHGERGLWIVPVYDLTRTIIKNNIICSNGGHGIFLQEHILTNQEILIESNTISFNGGDGILYDSKPQDLSIKNNIITNNGRYGINRAIGSLTLTYSYNDVWNNAAGDYNGVSSGTGDISLNPLFAESLNADFHPKSIAGRWSGTAWINDDMTSPCLDAGDPASDYSNEPTPNGGRINMGAYGNTGEASKSAPSGPDTIPPYTSGHSPAKDATGVSKDTNIIVHVKDDGEGVDQSSIVMTVEGIQVTPTITGIANNYTLTYNPPSDFDYDQVVNVTIDAKDLASPPNTMPQDSYYFTIQPAPDTTPPIVSNPLATPDTLLNDNGRPRAPGTNISQLSVTVTDDTEVDTVTIDLSLIGGSAEAQMTKIPGTDTWTITTNAVEGINIAHDLIVTATDISGNFNNTVSISLTVLRRGDVFRDNIIDMKDAVYITRYLAGLEPERSNPPSVLVGDIVGSGGDPTGDGIVNMKDAVYIARYKAGWEDEP